MSEVRLALLPRDGVACKDGRGWYTSALGRGHSHPWPPPSTVRGALRAAFGQLLVEREGRALTQQEWLDRTEGVALRRMLSLRRPQGEPFRAEHRMWPVPADALFMGMDGGPTRIDRLAPAPPSPGTSTLGVADDPALESLWRPRLPSRAKPLAPPAFWSEVEMRDWLRGTLPLYRPMPALHRRLDYHVTVDPHTGSAVPAMLYATELLETQEGAWEWALGVACALPEAIPCFPGGPVGLGGKRRLAMAEPLDPAVFTAPPDAPGPSIGLRLILATPAEFRRGWLPDGLEPGEEGGRPVYAGLLPGLKAEVVLRAALIPRPLHSSTWDMARNAPRPTRRRVPAGAVYFFQRRDGREFSKEELSALWLSAWGGGREEGLGLVLPGAWDPPNARGA